VGIAIRYLSHGYGRRGVRCGVCCNAHDTVRTQRKRPNAYAQAFR
jgi:hypothetical protein